MFPSWCLQPAFGPQTVQSHLAYTCCPAGAILGSNCWRGYQLLKDLDMKSAALEALAIKAVASAQA